MELLYCLALATAVVIAASVLGVLHVRRKRRAARSASRNLVPPPVQPHEAVESLAKMLGEQLQARVGKLQHLLSEVDQRIEELQQLSGDALSASSLARSALERQQAEVLRLSGQGLDGVEIARRLELDVGEVELMLNLHRRRVLSKE
jgi:DNA-binding NarL/FixJ family response regulator